MIGPYYRKGFKVIITAINVVDRRITFHVHRKKLWLVWKFQVSFTVQLKEISDKGIENAIEDALDHHIYKLFSTTLEDKVIERKIASYAGFENVVKALEEVRMEIHQGKLERLLEY